MANKYGQWNIIEPIGEGGQSHVYLAEDSQDQHKGQYALKALKNKERLGRFEREIKARLELEHADIPKVIDHNTTCEHPYLVETFIDGGQLGENRSLFEGDLVSLLSYFLQICDVIAHAHSKGVIHRDIKPENILYDKSRERFCVTDFGICFVSDGAQGERLTLLDEQVGSRDFIAPELGRGRAGSIGPASDIYSLGKLLYWMASGRALHREEHRTQDFELLAMWDGVQVERINKLLDRMVREEPSERYETVNQVIAAARNARILIQEKRNVIFRKWPQRCIYCGQGQYEFKVSYHPQRPGQKANELVAARQSLAQYGIKPLLDSLHYDLAVCNFCGNVQYFVRKPDNKCWEDFKYQPNE